MDSKTLSEAFGIEAEADDEEAEISEDENDAADESSLDEDIATAFDSTDPVERREAFIRAVKGASKG